MPDTFVFAISMPHESPTCGILFAVFRSKTFKKGGFMPRDIDTWRNLPNFNRDIFGLSQRLNRYFDDWMDRGSNYQDNFQVTPEMEETETHYLYSFDVPGIPRDNLQIEALGNVLRIRGERRENRAGTPSGTYGERRYQRVEESISLPPDVDSSKIEAEYRDGVLQIAIPKGTAQRSRRIEIGTGGGGLFSRLAHRMEEAMGSGTELPKSKGGKAA
jgi:HSP20 family protein